VNPGAGLETVATAVPGGVAAPKASAPASALNDRGKE
jgi:hypothetical protein